MTYKTSSTPDLLARVSEIDHDFEQATGWGSWMVMCANEREAIVNELDGRGIKIAHKYQARSENGKRVS